MDKWMDRKGAAICRDGTWKQGCGWRRRRFWISTGGSDRTATWGSPRSDEPGQTMLASEGHTWCSSFPVPRSPQNSLGLTRCTGPGAGRGKTCCSCSPSLPGPLPTEHHPANGSYCPSMTLLGPVCLRGQAGSAKGEFPHSPSYSWCDPGQEAQFHLSRLSHHSNIPFVIFLPSFPENKT